LLHRSKEAATSFFSKELNMSASPKLTESAPRHPVNAKPKPGATPPAIAFASLFHKRMVQFAEIQKTALDQIVRHNADFQGAWKQTSKAPFAPIAALMDLAGQGIERFAEVQKSLIDLTIQQSAMVLDISKQGTDEALKGSKEMAETVRRSIATLMAAENTVLELAAMQNTVATERIRRHFGMPATTPAVRAASA
jgi:hypothetical protein